MQIITIKKRLDHDLSIFLLPFCCFPEDFSSVVRFETCAFSWQVQTRVINRGMPPQKQGVRGGAVG
jgi:hypothetical protein